MTHLATPLLLAGSECLASPLSHLGSIWSLRRARRSPWFASATSTSVEDATIAPSLFTVASAVDTMERIGIKNIAEAVGILKHSLRHAVDSDSPSPSVAFTTNVIADKFHNCFYERRQHRHWNLVSSGGLLTLSFLRDGSLCLQRRGFRTRTMPATGMGKKSDQIDTGATILKRLWGLGGQSNPSTVMPEKMRSFLDQASTNPAEQEKLKHAFAEGYLAADKTKTASPQDRPRSSAFKLMGNLIFWVVIGYLFLSFFLENTGFKIKFISMNSTEVAPEDISVTFEDVRGIEEAKSEVIEIVEYLRDPEKFSRLGGRLPKGVLLVGPPGTGKTLLARAIAGEAHVPFFHASGSEFDEVLVGQGARRVRDLFATAKAKAPCVVFIDEIDSVGQKRSSSALHPYANQTINQLLAEMDGFKQNQGVIVLGATNRKEDLDKALLRPGRFDVTVEVMIPDLQGRKEILNLYLGKVKCNADVDVDVLAKGTTGFTGADIENTVNQAALRAAADGMTDVNMEYLESARDKVLMGPEKKHRIPDEMANKITAYHEAGHTLVAFYTKDALPLHKVTIIPRGPALGHTAYIPDREQYHITKAQMLANMDTLMGGRVAEEIVFGSEKITTGAADDLRKATGIATQMVKLLGMSDKVGFRTFEEDHGAIVVVNDLSPATSEAIDFEIKRLLNESYDRAKALLKTYAAAHKRLAEALMEFETLDSREIRAVIEGKTLPLEKGAPL